MAARILTKALPVAYVGTPYSFRAQVADITGSITWSLTGAPAGFSINTNTGLITSAAPINGIVGTYAVTLAIAGAGGNDSIGMNLVIRPQDVQRVSNLILDPRIEKLTRLFSAVPLSAEQIAAHFGRAVSSPSSPNDSPSYDRFPHTYLADRITHSADQISFEDLSVGIDNNTDTRSVKEVIEEVQASILLPSVDNVGGGVEIYESTISGVNNLRTLSGGQGTTVSVSGSVISVSASNNVLDNFALMTDSGGANGVPTVSISGSWRCGDLHRSPVDPYFSISGLSPQATAHYPDAHLYPYMTFGGLDVSGFPHNQHRRLGNGSIAINSGFNGYQDGPWLPPNRMTGVTVPFKMIGQIKCPSASSQPFVEVVFEPNVSISPPVYSPSPNADHRIICNTGDLGVSWPSVFDADVYKTIMFEGSISWHTYQTWSWNGTFNIYSSNGSAIFSKTLGGTGGVMRSPDDPFYFSYREGALLNIRFRIDEIPNLHAWDNTYQRSPNDPDANVLIFEHLDWNI